MKITQAEIREKLVLSRLLDGSANKWINWLTIQPRDEF